ncbi:hypothetical protein PG994_004324 [Apiospora phragmitis]|uniref:DUF7025 domain-containing protein n=1 Tax=Apiospora phragmitis TaxID=2905665 RepID=A0ABR1VQ99_9PEZI
MPQRPVVSDDATPEEDKGMVEDTPEKHPDDAGAAEDTTGEEEGIAPDDARKVDDDNALSEPMNAVKPQTELEHNATLWCPITMRSHAMLMDFRVYTCPVCRQYLLPKLAKKPPTVPAPASESNSESEDDNDKDKSERIESERILVTNTVDFRDALDDCVDRAPWPATFDLLEARKDVVDSDLAFEVVTILETSIPGEPGQAGLRNYPQGPVRGNLRAPFRGQTIPASNILSDPNLEIAVRQTTITIHSKALIELIKSVVSYYPSAKLDGRTVDLAEPFALLAHHYPQLEVLMARNFVSAETQEHETQKAGEEHLVYRQLECLLRFLKQPKYISSIEDEIAINARGLCTFRMLWYLLRPGSTVYLSRDGRLSAHIISDVIVDEKILRPKAKWVWPYEVYLWHLDFDGRHVGRSEDLVSIPAFEGEKLITSLRIFPVEYRDNSDGGETKRELEDQGKRWFGYLSGAQAHYSGDFIGPLGRQVRHLSIAAYSPHVADGLFGFVFKSRKWEVLDVKFCSPARIQPEALRSLVMPEERKTIIKALVEQYNTASSKDGSPQRKQWGADYIESKGEGQIFLLHGGPGLGNP